MSAKIWRLVAGYILAAAAASAIFSCYVFAIMLQQKGEVFNGAFILGFIYSQALVFLTTAVIALLPAMAAIAAAEKFHLRSVWFYLAAAALVALISTFAFQAFFRIAMYHPKGTPPIAAYSINWAMLIAGLVAGLVYWAFVGRNAGTTRVK